MDKITDLKISRIYCLMNHKDEILYDYIFKSIINLLTQKNFYKLNIKTIVTDTETALINIINKYFKDSQRLSCLFHFKNDIFRNLRSYGLCKKKYKNTSNELIKYLTWIDINYNGNIEFVYKKLNDIKQKYSLYINYINNYFIKNKICFFEDNSLNFI